MSTSDFRSRLTGLPDALYVFGLMAGLYAVFTGLTVLLNFELSGIVNTLRAITYFSAVYAMVVLALNLHWGYTGLFNLGVAGFMAVGVYTMAIVSGPTNPGPAEIPGLGMNLWVGVVAGVVMAALVGVLASLPALRLEADYLAIVTLALSEIIRLVLNSTLLQEVTVGGATFGTGGATGLTVQNNPQTPVTAFFQSGPGSALTDVAMGIGIDRPTVVEGIGYAIVLVVIVGLLFVFIRRIATSPFGRVLKAIREDQVVASALGKDTRQFKIIIFGVGCGLMGLAGILWYGSDGYINPLSFRPNITFYVFVALIIGGAGSNTGSIIGGSIFASVLFYLPQFLEQNSTPVLDGIQSVLGGSTATPQTIIDAGGALAGLDLTAFLAYCFANISSLRFIGVGLILIYLMQRRPDGLFGHRIETAASIPLTRGDTNE